MSKIYMMDPDGSIFTTEVPEYHKQATTLSQAKGKLALAEQSKGKLRELLKDHPTIYTVIRSVSSSGLSRTMEFWIVQGDSLRRITTLFIDVLGWGESPKGALKVQGIGMDMSWHACYSIYAILGLEVNKVNNTIL